MHSQGLCHSIRLFRFGFSAAIGRYHAFSEDCSGSESNLSLCPIAGSVCAADSAEHAVAIRCGASLTGKTS